MQAPLPLDYISQLIQGNYIDEARRGLASILEADPANAAAWSLAAWVAPDSERCDEALHKVIELTQDIRLRQWATRGLVLLEHTGTLDEEAPPTLRGGLAQGASREVAAAKPAGPKPRHPGYDIIQAGGVVMITGILLMVLSVVSPAFAAIFDRLPLSAGGCGGSLIALGAVVAYFGYQRK